jgi:hypothetical protein
MMILSGAYAPPFHRPRPVRVALTSAAQAAKLVDTEMYEAAETTEAA